MFLVSQIDVFVFFRVLPWMSGIACYLLTVYLAGYYIAEPHIRKEFPDVGSRLVVAFRMSVWLYLPLFSGINHDCVNLLLLLLELVS